MTTSRISFRIKRRIDDLSSFLEPNPKNDVPHVSAIIKAHGFFYPPTQRAQTSANEEQLVYSMNPTFVPKQQEDSAPFPPSPLMAGSPLLTVHESALEEGAVEEFKRISRIAMGKGMNDLPRVIPNKAAAQLGLLFDDEPQKNKAANTLQKKDSTKICGVKRSCLALIVFMVFIIAVGASTGMAVSGSPSVAADVGSTNSPSATTKAPSEAVQSTAQPTLAPTFAPSVTTARPTRLTQAPTKATLSPTKTPTIATFAPTTTTLAPTAATAAPTIATLAPTAATAAPTIATLAPTAATAAPTIATLTPTAATAAPTIATTAPKKALKSAPSIPTLVPSASPATL